MGNVLQLVPSAGETQGPSFWRSKKLGVAALIATVSFGAGAYLGLRQDAEQTAAVVAVQQDLRHEQDALLSAIDDKYPESAAAIGLNCYNTLKSLAIAGSSLDQNPFPTFESKALDSIPVLEDCGGLDTAASSVTRETTFSAKRAIATFETIRVGLDKEYGTQNTGSTAFDVSQVANTEDKIDEMIFAQPFVIKDKQDILAAAESRAEANETLYNGLTTATRAIAFSGLLYLLLAPRRQQDVEND